MEATDLYMARVQVAEAMEQGLSWEAVQRLDMVDNSSCLCKSSLAGFFVSGESGEAISPRNEALPTSSAGTFTNFLAT